MHSSNIAEHLFHAPLEEGMMQENLSGVKCGLCKAIFSECLCFPYEMNSRPVYYSSDEIRNTVEWLTKLSAVCMFRGDENLREDRERG